MLTEKQRWMVIASCFLVIPVMGALAYHGLQRFPSIPFERIQPQFDAASAIEYSRLLAEDYPDRVTGTPAAARAAEYLKGQFQKLGYHVSGDLFNLWLAGKRVEGQNVIAEVPGTIQESVAVIAHYDGQPTSHQGAEDNASGVGVMLELARVLRSAPRYRGLIFVATDAEEWGMIGARSLRGYLLSRNAVAVISIDYLTAGRARGIAIDCEGQRAGYTPMWLRQILKQSGAAQSVRVVGPSPLREWVERAVEVSAQDQGPLLREGIPALNVATMPDDVVAARARYHSDRDKFQNFQPETFRMVGATVEQAVSILDRLQPVPSREQRYLGLGGNRWLPRSSIEWTQMLGLVPFMLACVLAGLNFENDRLYHPLWNYIQPAIYMIPPAFGLFALHALTSAGILKRYELYPATPKDPFLYTIPVRVAAPLAAALVVGYIVLRVLRMFLPPMPEAFGALKRIFCVWMYVSVVWALYLDPFGMWFFLGPLAYGFLLLRPPTRATSRFQNAALLLLGACPMLILLVYFGRQIFLGWRIVWYLVLQSAYGVWSTSAVLLFLLTLVVWLQLFGLTVFGRSAAVRGEIHTGKGV